MKPDLEQVKWSLGRLKIETTHSICSVDIAENH